VRCDRLNGSCRRSVNVVIGLDIMDKKKRRKTAASGPLSPSTPAFNAFSRSRARNEHAILINLKDRKRRLISEYLLKFQRRPSAYWSFWIAIEFHQQEQEETATPVSYHAPSYCAAHLVRAEGIVPTIADRQEPWGEREEEVGFTSLRARSTRSIPPSGCTRA